MVAVSLQRRWQTSGRSRERLLTGNPVWAAPRSSKQLGEAEETNTQLKALAGGVRSRMAALIRWNKVLSARLQSQVEQLERLNRLRKFVSPQVAEVVIATDEASSLSHRREIAALFCDLRGFTAFSDTAAPESVLEVLRVYHQAMGELIEKFGGTIEHRAGDGIMVIFNAPLPCRDPGMSAVRLAVAMRKRMKALTTKWRKLGYQLGFGIGISLGYATLGTVGCEGRFDYVANGRAVNLASRLCDEASDGQILLSERAYDAVKERITTSYIGELALKGFRQPLKTFDVVELGRRRSLSRRAQGDKRHAANDQKRPSQLDWREWLSEEEIRNY
ncbi:MAG: adenylate/guanylate cyclase domain-containing protein [Gammaproteobacteria bacterium]|nr:adenylate/guanylate cyclase domain-containing protein [Gammaproteobacteria bacterium]